ncbi:MAG TPA: MFS transporter [Acidimicrobiales bacterium]|nr:MFS transporter [Acidimicrobiales bacterium]
MLLTLCVSLAAITVNLSLLNVAIPTLARALLATNTGLEWIVDGYALVFAGLLLAAGSLGDRVGRKGTLALGLGVFAGGSGLAALSHSTAALVAARCVMGVGAALVMPMTLSIMTDIYTTEAELRRAIGVWAATASAGSVVAPLAAGLLLSHFWWGSVFVFNVPVALGTMVAVLALVPSSAPRRDTAIDWVGVVLSVLFAGGMVFGLIEGPDRGWGDPLVAGSLAGAIAVGASFCAWELRSRHPLIDVRYFRLPRFSVGCGVVGVQYFFSFGSSFVVTQYVQLVLGLSALAAGLALMPSAAAVMVASPYGARAFGRYGARAVTSAGLLVAAVGAGSMALAGVHSSVGVILVSLVLVSTGIGLMAPGTTSMVMSAVPPEQAGMASGTQSATRQLGGALGVAVLGTILTARYTSVVTHGLAGTSGAPYLPSARRSLAAALASTGSASHAHDLVVRVSESAFVDGLHLVGVAAGLAAAACAGVVLGVLGRATRTATHTPAVAPAVVGARTGQSGPAGVPPAREAILSPGADASFSPGLSPGLADFAPGSPEPQP